MLHPSKSQAIVQWFNSTTEFIDIIESVSQLSDGLLFLEIINSIKSCKTEKASSIAEDSSKADTNLEEKSAEANSSEKSDKEKATDQDSVDCKGKNEGEIEQRYDLIKKFIDEFFILDSKDLISYSECVKGVDLELAKVAVMILSALVQSFVKTNTEKLFTATLLEAQTQEDIKECLSLVLMETGAEEGPLKRTELNRILSRPSKCKGTPRRKANTSRTSDVLETPGSSRILPKKRKDRAVLPEEVFESPLKSLLESPQMQFKGIMLRKDREISRITDELQAKCNEIVDFELEIRRLNAELGKTKREFDGMKDEYQKIQNRLDDMNIAEKNKMEEIHTEKERNNKMMNDLKEERDLLKTEIEKLYAEISSSKEKVSKNDDGMLKKLAEAVKELQQELSDKDAKINKMTQSLFNKEEEVKKCKESCEELKSSISIKCNERDLLTSKEDECDELRKQLEKEMEKSTELQKLLNEVKNECSDNEEKARSLKIELCNVQSDLESSQNELHNVQSDLKSAQNKLHKVQSELESTEKELHKVQSDLESTQKQLAIYENWAKNLENSNVRSENVDEIPSVNLIQHGLSPSTADEKERNIKEESESAQLSLWENCSVKSMETRSTSRCASALGFQKDPFSDESDLQNLKKEAISLVKLLSKIADTAEAQHIFKPLEEKARHLSSLKYLCEFYQSLQGTLKPMRLSLASKRKAKSQTAEEADSSIVCIWDKKKSFEAELERKKQEFQTQLEAMAHKVKEAEDKNKKLDITLQKLEDETVKSKQEADDAIRKYDICKKSLERLNQENKRLFKICTVLNKVPKTEPCKDCELLRETLSDVKQENRDLARDVAELKAFVRDMESRYNNVERQLQKEKKEREKLEFQIERESAFLSGTASQRNAVIHRYFQQGLAESRKPRIRAERERKFLNKPQPVVSFNTFILNQDNKDPCLENSMSTSFANRSIRSGFLQTDDEEDFINHSSLAQIHLEDFPEPECDGKRLTEIQRRNTLCLPHLQSSYPLELQNMTPTENKYYNPKPFRKTSETPFEDGNHLDSEDSQDVMRLPLRKRKILEKEHISVQPLKKPARSVPQVKLIQKVKPITPVRKTGFISKTKSFKTPTSIRRLMRMQHKNKNQ